MKHKQNRHKDTAGKVSREGPSKAKTGLIRAVDAKPIRISPGKLLQVQGLILRGESQRQVARELRVSRNTVSKVVKTADFQSFIVQQRENLFSIVPAAVESLRTAVSVDGYLAHRLLTDVGIVPDRQTMLALANAPSSMTPEEQGFRRQVEMVTAVLLESHENFGTALPPGLDAKLKQPEPGNGSRKTK